MATTEIHTHAAGASAGADAGAGGAARAGAGALVGGIAPTEHEPPRRLTEENYYR